MSGRRAPEPDPPVLRSMMLPLGLVTVFLLMYVARLPFGLAVLGAAPFVAAFLAAPVWARRSMQAFDRDAVRLLSTKRHDALPARLSRAVGMRLFAPVAHLAERQGLVFAERGDAARARRAYRRALEAWDDPAHAPVAVVLGLAHASYAVGEDADAIALYERVRTEREGLPNVEKNLAHAMIRKGERVQEALALLDEAEKKTSSDEVRAEITAIRREARKRSR